LCRTDREIPKEERRKLALFCNVHETAVIEARDVETSTRCPRPITKPASTARLLAAFGIESAPIPDLAVWRFINERIRNPEGNVTIAIVGNIPG